MTPAGARASGPVTNTEGTTPGPAVRIEDLRFTHRAGSEETLRGISFIVQPEEFVTIMGPSGAGKSTLCQSLNGLVPRQVKGELDGYVEVCGKKPSEERVASMAPWVGLVFQDFEAQLFSTNAELEVAFSVENLRMDPEHIKKRVAECLEQVKLAGFEDRQPATLSGGQKQRLAIASVLAASPSVMCLDEPTTDLDPVGKTEVFSIANGLTKTGMTLIVVEHETAEALVASRLILMDDGRVVRDGPSHEVLREVETFEQLRIMPLQIPELFARVGYSAKGRPLTVEEARQYYLSGDLVVDAQVHEGLVERDKERSSKYGPKLIEVRDVTYRYPTGLNAVEGVSLDVRKGEFLAVLGQNGSGKTTLVKQLNGLLKPTRGSVVVAGTDTRQASLLELGEQVGYVFQNPDHQIFSDTVFDEVAFALKKRKIPDQEIKQRVADVLEAVGLGGQEEDDPFSLTKGHRQRVAVASTLALRPDVLILDEPTTGLDYGQQKSMMELVQRLNERGSTIVVVTHAMWVVCEYAHRVVVMQGGHVVVDDMTRRVFAQEETLEDMALAPPPIVALSSALGHTALSVAEMEAMTKKSR